MDWCYKWNMKVSPEKTSVLIFDKKRDDLVLDNVSIELGNTRIPISRFKKVLGVTIDDKFTFEKHLEDRTAAGFGALKGLDGFISQNSGCTQSQYIKLYKSLVLPVMDYGAAVLVSANDSFHKHFGQVQRSAMLKATGCLRTTSSDALEVLSNCLPMDLHMKLRQAQEVVRIAEKTQKDPLREEFDQWMTENSNFRGKPIAFQILLSRFNEIRQDIQFENIEKEFEYSKEHFGLSRKREYINKENFNNDKDLQVDNIKDILASCDQDTVLAFTDGSALNNPGPTGAGAAIYLNGYQSTPVLLNKPVRKHGNNFAGEIVGIEIALEFLVSLDTANNRKIHVFTDCQAAILSAFCKEIPSQMIENVINIKKALGSLQNRMNTVEVHWVPGHKNLTGNELADQQAKVAAKEMDQMEGEDSGMRDGKDAVKVMKEMVLEKWNRKFLLSESSDTIQEIYKEVGKRPKTGEEDRKTYSILNQLICGHTKLNAHWSKVDNNISPLCENCKIPETVQHFIFYCKRFDEQRAFLENQVEEILYRDGVNISTITLATLVGEIQDISNDAKEQLIEALCDFIRNTKRFF